MSPPREGADVTTTPAPKSEVATTDAPKRSGRFLAAVAALPYSIPRWLDRLAVRAAQRLGKGRL